MLDFIKWVGGAWVITCIVLMAGMELIVRLL